MKKTTTPQPNATDSMAIDDGSDNKNATGQIYEFIDDFNSDLEVHDGYTTDFDAYEAMLISKTYDSVSKQTKNGITDSDAATMIIERSARVVGQLPEGEVTAAGKKDKGKAQLMNILVQKWIYPNANAQRPFLDKIRLWEQYSDVYGIMPMYYDWDVSPSGYVGPNCWLWSPRNFIPQQGRYSIADMDYVHAISYMGKKEIEEEVAHLKRDPQYAKDSGWNLGNLQQLLDQNASKNNTKSQDTNRDSYVERTRVSRSIKGKTMIVTRYESGCREYNKDGSVKEYGHWVTFSPDFAGLELRDVENPHKNGRIPFVIKPCIPLFDSFYGLSDMARAKPIQFAKDGLTNFYFQGIKMNIYPPTVVNAQGILKHTVSNEPGSIWEEIIPNSARRLETSTAGLATYQAAMGQMSGALQNVFGTTTTQMNSNTAMSAQFGKTPEAIKYQSGRESARDNQNRAYLQQAIEELHDGMMSLFAAMGTEQIPIDLFTEDIMEIKNAGYEDVMEMIKPNESKQTGRLTIDPKSLKGVEYRFNMMPDSTIKQDKDSQKQDIAEIMGVLGQNANVLQDMAKTTGKMPNWEALLNSYLNLSDIPSVDQAFISAPQPKDPNEHPVMRLLENLNIKFETLPEDAKMQILKMTLGIDSQDPSPMQQSLDIKRAEAASKVIDTAHKTNQPPVEPAAPPEPQAPPPQSPITPQSVNGMLFRDPAIHAVATDLHSMRPAPTKMPAQPVGAGVPTNAG